MELDPQLKDLSLVNQNIVAIYYLDHLTSGHIYHGFRVRYSTLKQNMDAMAAWMKRHTSSDIGIKPGLEKPREQLKQHPMIDTIYNDTKH